MGECPSRPTPSPASASSASGPQCVHAAPLEEGLCRRAYTQRGGHSSDPERWLLHRALVFEQRLANNADSVPAGFAVGVVVILAGFPDAYSANRSLRVAVVDVAQPAPLRQGCSRL